MIEQLLKDYLNGVGAWNFLTVEITNVVVVDGLVTFDEVPIQYSPVQHTIPLLDILAWVYNNTTKQEKQL